MKIWCLLRDQLAHIKPIEEAMASEAEFIHDSEWDPSPMVREKPNLVLCINDYPLDILRCLDAARGDGIPSLVLQDGILEWRCQYENPLFGAGGGAPQHQPVMADKIACIGHESLRRIAGWGNDARVELTGMPRLDYLCSRASEPTEKPGRRLLVMTAKNPGFNARQRETTLRSLRELKAHLDTLSHIQTLWRLSRGVATELGVANQLDQIASAELVGVVENVDAVISTPSTAMLEAMLLGRPVAALDYHNVPTFVRTAWVISAPEHIRTVIPELLDPPPAKIAFQQESLADNLVCDGSSVQRVCALIRKMVAFAASSNLKQCRMPSDLLGTQSSYTFFPQKRLNQLYAGQSVFEELDPEKLQIRLARAENENTRLRADNAELKKRVQLGSWVKSGVRKLAATARGQ
ncbi:MAG: hypothetical protein H0X66_03695 [Verrucomicrobia bacterium]|nr:hypothetical protein [Verrucomicrobiota bacterium]